MVSKTRAQGIVLNTMFSAEDNIVSAANKANQILLYLHQSFATVFLCPCLEYTIQATPPILSRDVKALGKAKRLAVTFVKGLLHEPYVSAIHSYPLVDPWRFNIHFQGHP